MIALGVTSVLFACLIFVFFQMGAFEITTRPVSPAVKDSMNDLNKQTSGFWDQTSGQLNEISSSTKAIGDQLQTINDLAASSTASSTTASATTTTSKKNF